MNELICEMCGSNNIVKQDGLYVCQSCNTKYSVEEAKKMMFGEVVEIEGTVKIDDSFQIDNLRKLALRSFNSGNYNDALKYYNRILIKEPDDWESRFHVLYCKAETCHINEILIIEKSILNSIKEIVDSIKKNVPQDNQVYVLNDILLKLFELYDCLLKKSLSINHSKNKKEEIHKSKNKKVALSESISLLIYIFYDFGDEIMGAFDGEYSGFSVRSWIKGIEIHRRFYHLVQDKDIINKSNNYIKKVLEYQPDFESRPFKNKKCYIATNVYGSYDCPEVWTLRRFRDNTLDKNIFGRLFIKTYYLTSPTLVKYFGDKKAFNMIFKPILDSFVKKLNKRGVKSTFYIDK